MDNANRGQIDVDTITRFFNKNVTNVLTQYFNVKCCEKGHEWFEPWEGHFRKAFSLYASKGYYYHILWGYNADFIPRQHNSGRFIYHRTEKAVTVHIEDSFYDHVYYDSDIMDNHKISQFKNKYCLSSLNFDYMNLTSDDIINNYVEDVTRRNIPFILDFFERVKTVDEMINYLDMKMRHEDMFYSHDLYYNKAFLLAYKKQMGQAVQTLEIIYSEGIPDELMKRLQKAYELA